MFDSDRDVFVIAEVGVNHNGDPNLAAELVDIAREVGADAVKFQKRNVETLATDEILNKGYRYYE